MSMARMAASLRSMPLPEQELHQGVFNGVRSSRRHILAFRAEGSKERGEPAGGHEGEGRTRTFGQVFRIDR